MSGLGGVWVLPCNVEINVTFMIGGKAYPVHPLDTVTDNSLIDPDGITCYGAVRCFRAIRDMHAVPNSLLL